MKITIRQLAPAFAAAAIGGAVVLAPIASAATQPLPVSYSTATQPAPGTGPDPLVPYGATPYTPFYNSPGDTYSGDPNDDDGPNNPGIDSAF
jgi:hypothetical protein